MSGLSLKNLMSSMVVSPFLFKKYSFVRGENKKVPHPHWDEGLRGATQIRRFFGKKQPSCALREALSPRLGKWIPHTNRRRFSPSRLSLDGFFDADGFPHRRVFFSYTVYQSLLEKSRGLAQKSRKKTLLPQSHAFFYGDIGDLGVGIHAVEDIRRLKIHCKRAFARLFFQLKGLLGEQR